MVKVFLSTPCYGGLCLDKYMTSIIKLQLLLINKNIQLMLDTTENESLVHRARNVSVGRYMQKTDADYFMFIDADIDFDPESVLKLLESTHDQPEENKPQAVDECSSATQDRVQPHAQIVLKAKGTDKMTQHTP